MFCDHTILKLMAGNGGKGCVAFRREKFIAKGGPNGGDGGKGGDVYFKVNTSLNTLTHLDTYKQFEAQKGEMGKGQNKHGYNGEDLILEVPLGTMVFERHTDEEGNFLDRTLIADLSTPNKTLLVAKGGRGGYGNAHFVSSVRQAPKFAELGEEGEEIEVELELKLVADVGIIGIPSAGKSTLISVISNAKPKIAEYHFTTLRPNLGVVKIADKVTYVVADIPGLIENASEGKGLGIEFLKHVQRCRFLVHLVDPYQNNLRSTTNDEEDPAIDNFHLIDEELKKFSEDLAEKQQVLVINKSDLISDEEEARLRKKLEAICSKDDRLKLFPHSISAATTQGIDELKTALFQELEEIKSQDIPEESSEEDRNEEVDLLAEKPTEEHIVYRPHLENPKYFSIEKDPEEDHYIVRGQRIEQIVNMTDMNNREAMMRVEDVLKKMGIAKELKKQGARSGSELTIGKNTFEFRDPNEF